MNAKTNNPKKSSEQLRLIGFSIKLNALDLARLKEIQELTGESRSAVIRYLINNQSKIVADTRKIMKKLDTTGIALADSSACLKNYISSKQPLKPKQGIQQVSDPELSKLIASNFARITDCSKTLRQLMRAL